MYRKLSAILVVFLLAGCADRTGGFGYPTATVEDGNLTMVSIEGLAAEFKNLRAIKGHFDGGDWNDDVDKWMGHKHQVMIELGLHLGTGEYDNTKVIRLLGSPDLIAREGDDLFRWVSDLPEFEELTGSYELLIYTWRGTHDFLYFVSQDEVVVGSGWWYAGE